MKHITLSIMLLSIVGIASAQKLVASKVPVAAKNAFEKAHPGVSATWEKEDGNFEANFKEEGKNKSCVVSRSGSILETETPISQSELPKEAAAYMNQHYKGKKWKEVAKIEKASGEVNYEVNAEHDILFDANGKHISKREKKD